MKRKERALFGGIVALAFLMFAMPAIAQPTITNGDLTGPVAISSAPPSWFNWQKTPDTADALGPFNNTPTAWTLSPNGGTFVRAGGSTFTNSEAIAQNVSGFTIGNTYVIDFFQTNLGFEHPSSGAWIGESGFWEFVVDGSVSDASTILSKQTLNTDPIVWFGDSFSFVATATTQELAFVSRTVSAGGLAAYMGIDGISIRAIPAPGTAALSALLLGASCRRRRTR
jgi:hypothetical protein